MGLELHRRDEASDADVRLVKVFPKWLTADQYEEIPRQEAEALAHVLIATLPPKTLSELARLLSGSVARADPATSS